MCTNGTTGTNVYLRVGCTCTCALVLYMFQYDNSLRFIFQLRLLFLCSIAGNGIESVLHITEVTDDDYDGVFKCLAFNVHTEQPSRLFRLKYSEYQYQ